MLQVGTSCILKDGSTDERDKIHPDNSSKRFCCLRYFKLTNIEPFGILLVAALEYRVDKYKEKYVAMNRVPNSGTYECMKNSQVSNFLLTV